MKWDAQYELHKEGRDHREGGGKWQRKGTRDGYTVPKRVTMRISERSSPACNINRMSTFLLVCREGTGWLSRSDHRQQINYITVCIYWSTTMGLEGLAARQEAAATQRWHSGHKAFHWVALSTWTDYSHKHKATGSSAIRKCRKLIVMTNLNQSKLLSTVICKLNIHNESKRKRISNECGWKGKTNDSNLKGQETWLRLVAEDDKVGLCDRDSGVETTELTGETWKGIKRCLQGFTAGAWFICHHRATGQRLPSHATLLLISLMKCHHHYS